MPAHTKGVLIKAGGTTDGSVMRGRDVEFELKDVDLDPRVKSVLYRLAEINHVNMKAIAEIAMLTEKFTDIVINMTTVADNMKTAIGQMKRQEADVDGDITTDTRN